MTEVVIDLETTGTRPGCAILSIGAVATVPGREYEELEFYATIDLEDCMAAGLTLDAETLGWWMQQSFDVRDEAFSGERPLLPVLREFAAWLASVKSDGGIEIYGNGPSFDCAILAAAYVATGLAIPWRYSRERCVRTVVAEAARLLGADYVARLKCVSDVPHHALYDARAEMRMMRRLRRLTQLLCQPAKCSHAADIKVIMSMPLNP